MSDEDALLAAICADPADDTARLAFADLLDEDGGPTEAAWAKFIRAHLRLGTGIEMPGDVPTVLELGSDEWAGRFAARLGFPVGGVNVSNFDRGLPDELTGGYLPFRRHWNELLTRTPFRRLVVTGVEDEAVEDFVMWPALERLTALELTTHDDTQLERRFGVRGVAALTSCPALSGLESLALNGLGLTEHIADLILNSRNLRRLRELRIVSVPGVWAAEYDAGRVRLESRFGRITPYHYHHW